MKAQLVEASNPFEASRAEFERLVAELETSSTRELKHSELEDLIQGKGREVLRLLYQDHVRLRGPGRAAEAVVGTDDVVRTHVRERGGKLKTIFGSVTFPRAEYSAPGVPMLAPLEAQLNLPEESFSHGMRRRTAVEASKSSFHEAVTTVEEMTGEVVGMRQAEELTARAAQDWHAFYDARNAGLDESLGKTGDILVLTMDQKGVVLRKEDLREATRKAAEKRVFKLNKRLTKGEKRNAKRMATVAAVYTVEPFDRSAEDLLAELRGIQNLEEKLKRPRPEYKRVWATLEQEMEDVVAEMFQEAVRRDPSMQKKWVVLVDGNETQIRLIQEHAQRIGVTVTLILDIIHVTEYLWKAVTTFHKEGTSKAEAWVSERLLGILQGNVSNVAAGIRRSATLNGIPKAKRKAVDKCADYLLKYSGYLQYDVYLFAGFPIATGVVEGACRHLIKDRMDITGARWSLIGAEAVLRLRSLRSSGDFDEYWLFHEAQEFKRNHSARYAGGHVPPITKTHSSSTPDLRLLH